MRIGPDTEISEREINAVGGGSRKEQKREGVSVRFSERRAEARARQPQTRVETCAASAHGERVASNLKERSGI